MRNRKGSCIFLAVNAHIFKIIGNAFNLGSGSFRFFHIPENSVYLIFQTVIIWLQEEVCKIIGFLKAVLVYKFLNLFIICKTRYIYIFFIIKNILGKRGKS